MKCRMLLVADVSTGECSSTKVLNLLLLFNGLVAKEVAIGLIAFSVNKVMQRKLAASCFTARLGLERAIRTLCHELLTGLRVVL